MERSGSDILGGRGDIEYYSAEHAEHHEEQERLTRLDKNRRKIKELPNTGNPEDDLIAKLDRERTGEEENFDIAPATEPREPSKTRWSDSLDTEFDEHGQPSEDKPDRSVEPEAGKTYNQQSQSKPQRREDNYDYTRAQKRYPSKARKSLDANIRDAQQDNRKQQSL